MTPERRRSRVSDDTKSTSQPAPSWAKVAGRLNLKPLPKLRKPDEALDRLLIAERIFRYGWAYDERDRELFTDCFTEDVVWEGNVMGIAPVGPFIGRQAVVDFNCDFWPVQSDQRRHIFTNVIIDDLTRDGAVAHAYLLLTSASKSQMLPITSGPYRIDLVKEDSWRIKHLWSSFDAPF
jgi:hypothetical protein